jgi:membrane-associated phospholipid phosphatase
MIWPDQREIWTSPLRVGKNDLKWLLPAAAVTGLLMATDHHTMTLIHSDAAVRSRSANISNFGLAAFAAGSFASFSIGAITRNEHARETGILTAEAMADSFLVSEALKLAIQRERPQLDGSHGLLWQQESLSSSFPSQHAALAWSAAAVLAREYPGTITQWSAYGLASLISISRITAEAHFPSDVVVGAIAGYLIGRHIYNAHHNDKLTDETGATPVVTSAVSQHLQPHRSDAPAGSVYIPIDSWIYPALRRIAALGYIPDQVSDLAPWTRAECIRQVEEAYDLAERRADRDGQTSLNRYVLTLLADLKAEFSHEPTEQNAVRLESIYTRMMDIQGAPLRDSYHFGQTLDNDLGRPYGEGFNNVTGISGYAVSGRFSAYFRGEYQEAPGADGYSLPVRQFIAAADQNPLQGPAPIAATNRFEPLEMYTGVQLGIENITFGKQSLWWGPSEQSAFSFSNNAAPFYMLRFAQTRPFVLPGIFSRLGKIRTEFIFGKLSGHEWPPRPFVNAQKISLDLTDNLELGFTRSAFFGGVGHPLTLGSFEASLFNVNSADFGPYGSPDLPGDRHSDFDFRWRMPGLRRYLTFYSDSYADDDPNPLDNPKRSAWSPGLYFSHLPGLRKLDFTVETVSTWLYRQDAGGDFIYFDGQYHDSYTNDGNLLGSWIGRDSRAYEATANYWISSKSKLQGQYRQIKAAAKFLPGGGTQTDASLSAQIALRPEWLMSAEVQVERYYIPILGGPEKDIVCSFQLTFTPSNWIKQK